ncbi:hypothetical protein POM88_051864 [Heracleum sosnowskyi]|uniref:KIB1-4 beta-propeller domain-containing protein n=1 Tax=Heracleum sosnowskyi TaxID=360622 RepID=A0AAD8GS47_9APIA|nr:hypothetical protein POM88_051864 [Heracleum sosnowskyi]
MKKRCRKGEADERNDTKKKIILLSSSPAETTATWSELPFDALGEIKKKLFWRDHVRFNGVCKNWLAAQHAKRAGDVLPWFLLLDLQNDLRRVSYSMYEPSASNPDPVISYHLYISQFFDISLVRIPYRITYLHGCLLISTYDREYSSSYFLLFSLATQNIIELPRINHHVVSPTRRISELFTAVSTNPTSPDCVFLALHITTDPCEWIISTFRHGDTYWTTTVPLGGFYNIPEVPCVEDILFIRGAFYFLFLGGRLVSYDIATMALQNYYTSLQDIHKFDKFFVLDDELVVTYIDREASNCIRRFDWSQKDWFPLESLKDRSLFLSKHSVFVDTTNCYGVSSNKIYIHKERNCYVYSLENGKVCNCTSGLTNWDGMDYNPESSIRGLAENNKISLWVEPPNLLLQK